MKNYDKIILEHYKQVASESGDSHLSTMSHEFIREMETKDILSFIVYFIEHKSVSKSATIADVGCGNGFLLQIMSKSYPGFNYICENIENAIELENRLVNLPITTK